MVEEEKVLYNAVLVFLKRGDDVLIALKKEKIGKDCWNGYGGGIEKGETPEKAALRELAEESGAIGLPEDLEKVAILFITNVTTQGVSFLTKLHVYTLSRWTGEIQETKKMANPRWFSSDRLPLGSMMPADPYWVPRIVRGEKGVVTACYGPFQKTLLTPVQFESVVDLSSR
jgi:8-oxo-dGTP diphosphatase